MQKQKCGASGNRGCLWLLWGSCEVGQEHGGGGGVQQSPPSGLMTSPPPSNNPISLSALIHRKNAFEKTDFRLNLVSERLQIEAKDNN